jgi:GSH-dependent disulfide-bond oxidoreductase
MIDFYGCATPNCRKVAITLQELNERAVLHRVDIEHGEQLATNFRTLNPNAKVPVIVDHAAESSKPLVVWESGAVLMYLADKHGQLGGTGAAGRAAVGQWLMWQVSALGPTAGHLAYFGRRSPRRLPLAIERFSLELHRLWGVLDGQLRQHRFVAGDDCSIADIAIYPWWVALSEVPVVTRRSAVADRWLPALLNLKRTPAKAYRNIEGWAESLAQRPAVRTGMAAFESDVDGALFATDVPIGESRSQLGDASLNPRA